MKTVNSISGGKTSAYIAANYPADYNVFALVRTIDKNCMFPDKKIRQIVSDKIGKEFVGTLEMDTIIYTMLDLEQYIGSKIDWVSGETFDEVIQRGDKIALPTPMRRFCTVEMKIKPIFDFWRENINEIVETRIGFRANETKRAKSMIERCKPTDGVMTYKAIIGKSKTGNRNKWDDIPYQIPSFPLIDDSIYKDKVELYWEDKPVRFAYMNNCVGCMHRNPILLKHMDNKEPNKMQWFIDKEKKAMESYNNNQWIHGITYEQIRNTLTQTRLFDDDFNECDSGYCGL
tara:strand:- start:353 stop:1216 length:864 start_codon:yes stop_codon:yes gene_type:complete